MSLDLRWLLLLATIINLLFFLRCASTPPPQLDQDELRMLAEIQREKGERNAQITSECLQEAKSIRQEDGEEEALGYLMRVGIRYPYEAMRIRQTLFGELVTTEFDDELKMLAEIRSERGERNAHRALKLLQEAKVIQRREGKQRAFEYLMRVGTRYPYEALKIRERLFPEVAATESDRELQMVAEIQREKGERSAQIASRFLVQTKLIRQKQGKQKALEYLTRIGMHYPYEALKIRETLFREKAGADAEARAEEPRVSSKEEGKASQKERVPPSFSEPGEPTRVTRKKDLRGAHYFSQGMEAYENGEYQLCIDKLSKAIPLLKGEEERIDAFKTMAFAYMAFPRQQEARQQFCNILSLDPAFELDPVMTPPKILAVFQEAREKCLLARGFKKKFALVVGISNYRNRGESGLTNLLFADDDAHDFSEALKGLGWRSSHIKTLINERATKRNIEIALESWLTKAGKDDLVVLYWSGHGFQDPEVPERVYFACYDSAISIPATGYRMDRVRESLEERGCRNVLFFADTCHAGTMITRGERGISVVPHLQRLREEKKIPRGWVFMVGAETDRRAVENSSWSNGAFTHCPIEGIMGKADGFESMGLRDGRVTMGELRAYLNTAMPDETQKVFGVAKRPVIATTTGDPSIWDLSLTD